MNSINVSTEGVKIEAVKVELGNYATVGDLQAVSIEVTDLMSGDASASKLVASTINVSNLEITNKLEYGGYGDLKKKIINAFSSSSSSGTITISSTTLDGSAGPSVNFSIADTQFYKDGVAAAKTAGWNAAAAKFRRVGNYVYGPGSSYGSEESYHASLG